MYPPLRSRRSLLSLAFAASLLGALRPSPALPADALAWRSEGPFLGTVVDVAFDPRTPGLAYAAATHGGVFRSTDGGHSWVAAGRPKTNRDIEWLEVDPGTPGTLWLGVDNPGKPALWRSRDQGATWSAVTDSYRGQLTTLHPVGYRIAFAPSRPADIWVPSTNLHYRSRDGGKSWSDFRVEGQDAYAMAVDPQNPDVVYAGGHGGEQAHLSRSDDGGKSWKPVGAGLEPAIQALVVDPVTSATVYAVSSASKLWKSVDRGATFTALAVPVGGTEDIYNLRFGPGDPRQLWLACEKGLFRSADGGATWQRSDGGSGRYLVRATAVDPANARQMLAASSGGGVYRSSDGGASWAPSSAGLAAAWVERIDASPASATIFVQTATGLFRRDASGTWDEKAEPFEDDGDEVELDGLLFDGKSPETIWAFDGSSAWRSSDGGRSFRALEKKEPSMRDLMKGQLASAQFRSLAQDPGNPNILYAGSWSNDDPGQAVWKSLDGGKSFKAAGAGLPGDDVKLLRAAAPGVVYAVVDKALFRTDDGGAKWLAVGGGLPAATELRAVGLDPVQPARLFVATEKGLFLSNDSGANFQKAGSALADEDVEAVAVAPDGRLYAGSWRGLFTSRDAGVTWTSLSESLPHRDVRALAVGGAPGSLRLWVGTAGGGVFSTPLP
ncbi:MAG: hypothetical protein KBI44_20475 [Thermoanaerobaculia bacterium]|nr:hypothetical protein [Thermoanaerobaculia bacterium]